MLDTEKDNDPIPSYENIESKLRAFLSNTTAQFTKTLIDCYQEARSIPNAIPVINLFVLEVINNCTPKNSLLNNRLKRMILEYLHKIIFEKIYPTFVKYYEQKYVKLDKAFLKLCIRHKDMPFAEILGNTMKSPHWDEAVKHLKDLEANQSPYGKVLCMLKMSASIHSVFIPKAIGADEYWEALVWVLLKAKPEKMISHIKMIRDTLKDFLTDSDNYIFVAFQSIIDNFKSVLTREDIKKTK